MADSPRYFLTTAIDYPNSRPHIGTAFEKLGADVQARYRRMEGHEVFFLMGNDENTVKVSKRAAELGLDPKPYCDDMARQFKEVWRALDISFDDFIQTSDARHHAACRQFIQKVYDNGHIYKGQYEGWYCEGCEAFKTETEIQEAGGVCPLHPAQRPIRRSEPCYFFALSKFQEKLLQFYNENPDFIQPESRKNEVLHFVQSGLKDTNITRRGEAWGIRTPFDEDFTIYVWFDALLNYVTGVGYATDEERFRKWWPADLHVIGKDITRFHCALWPAMCMAAGIEPPRRVFGHGFVYIRDDETGEYVKGSKSGIAVDPMKLVEKYGADGTRYYFLRECPFPGDGEFSWRRFEDLFNADLANNLGNTYSRVVKLVSQNYDGRLEGTAGLEPGVIYTEVDTEATAKQVQAHIEACQYNQALQRIWLQVLNPTSKYLGETAPWKLVKIDKTAAKRVLYDVAEQLRVATILLKPFLPKAAETIYTSFNFPQPWVDVSFEDVWAHPRQGEDLRVLAALHEGKVKPLFPRIAV